MTLYSTPLTIFCTLLVCTGSAQAIDAPSYALSATGLPDYPGSNQIFGHDIVVIAPDDIWALGEWHATFPGPGGGTELGTQSFHFDGESWVRFEPPNHASTCNGLVWSVARSIDAISSGQVYAAGEYKRDSCQSTDTLMHEYTDGSWEQVITPGQTAFGVQGFLFAAVYVTDDGAVWMGGQFSAPGGAGSPRPTVIRSTGAGGFDRWDGDLVLNASHRIRAIDSTSPTDIWAVGSAGGGGIAVGRSYAMHYDGSGFTEMSPPQISFGEIIRAVEAIASDDVWLSGKYDIINPDGSITIMPLMWHWDGSGWEQFDSPGFANDLVHFASDDVYGISGRTLIHWDGTEWSVAAVVPDEIALNASLRSIDIVRPGELIAIGDQGASGTTGRTSVVVHFDANQGDCLADITGDSRLNFFDVSAFLNTMPDFNNDGAFNFFDVSAFLNAFAEGCP